MKLKIFILILTIILVLPFLQSGNLSLFPNPGLSEAGNSILYSFNFSNSTNCLAANIILNHTEVVTINSRGYGYVSIDISNLSQVPISLCEYKDATYDLRKNHSFSDIIFNTIYAKNLNLSGDVIITGSVYVTENITAAYFFGNGSQLTDISASAISDIWVNESGDTMTGDLNMSLNKLTTIGELVMAGIIRGQNIIPITTNLYSLGNSTNWFKELFVGTIQSININTSNLNATNITSSDIESDDMQSDRINATNFTIAGYKITEDGGDLTIELT